MRRTEIATLRAFDAFQSSPSTLAGCDFSSAERSASSDQFQSSPSTLAGCDQIDRDVGARGHTVSILTQHAGRVRHKLTGEIEQDFPVSILTQHAGRVRRGVQQLMSTPPPFQSSPSTLAGCDAPQSRRYGLPEGVSILTQHAGRVRQGVAGRCGAAQQFQSSPSTLAGCDLLW